MTPVTTMVQVITITPLSLTTQVTTDASLTQPCQQSLCLQAAADRYSQEHRTAPDRHVQDQHHNGTTTHDTALAELDASEPAHMEQVHTERAQVVHARCPPLPDPRHMFGVRR